MKEIAASPRYKPARDPTPAEIAAARLAIQQEWSDTERRKRWLGPRRIRPDYSRERRVEDC